jgi:hypothetical protein
MSQLKMTFDNYVNNIEERQEVTGVIKDCLDNDPAWQKQKKIVGLERAKLKQIELNIKAGLRSEMDKLEEIKNEINNDKQVMTDQALAIFSKGQPVTVKDKWGTAYEAEFSVRFKKCDEQD